MKITKTEEVTRTYCDVCGRDITRANQYGVGGWVICGRKLSDIRGNPARGRSIAITCDDMAEIWIDNPSIANWQTEESIKEMQNA